MMKADRVRKIIAAVAVVAGAAWLASVLPPLFRPPASGHREFYDWFFVCTTGPLMAIPGVGCICWGVRLFRRMMKADRVRKIIAAVAVVAGAAWLAGVLPPLFRPLASGPREFYDWFFVCTTGPLMAIPGVGCICWGVRLFRRMDFAALKGIVGLVSVLGVIWISRYVPKGWAGSLPSSVKSSLGMLVGIAAAMLVYLVSVQRVLPLFGDEKRRLRDYLGRPVLQVLALLLWQLLSALSHEYVPAVLKPDSAWMLIASLGPILLAWGSYRMAVDKLLPVKAEGVDSIGRSAH